LNLADSSIDYPIVEIDLDLYAETLINIPDTPLNQSFFKIFLMEEKNILFLYFDKKIISYHLTTNYQLQAYEMNEEMLFFLVFNNYFISFGEFNF
jgi:hypothetical protein